MCLCRATWCLVAMSRWMNLPELTRAIEVKSTRPWTSSMETARELPIEIGYPVGKLFSIWRPSAALDDGTARFTVSSMRSQNAEDFEGRARALLSVTQILVWQCASLWALTVRDSFGGIAEERDRSKWIPKHAPAFAA